MFKSDIGCFIENLEYSPNEFFEELEENEYNINLIMYEFTQKIEKVSNKTHKKYMDFFETIRDLLIKDFVEKKSDLKEKLELTCNY